MWFVQGFNLFGASRHQYILNPPLSRRKLNKIEKEYGISLPEDYRFFLLHFANGGAGPGYELFDLLYCLNHDTHVTLQGTCSLTDAIAKEIITKRIEKPDSYVMLERTKLNGKKSSSYKMDN